MKAKKQVIEELEQDLKTLPFTDTCDDFMPRAYVANNKSLKYLNELDRLARSGDSDAVRMFHGITCGMVNRLNELHSEYATSVLKWPILLPQDRKERNKVTKAANEMYIGSVAAGGKGRPSELAYNTEKGFSIHNLRRVDFARALLSPIPPAYADMDGKPIKPRSRAKDWFDDPEAFIGVTEINYFDLKLLNDIGNLPEYCPKTQGKWIALILRLLAMNPNLIPPEITKRSSTKSKASKATGGVEQVVAERGGRLKKTLKDGLSKVFAVPGLWGD